MQPPSPSLATRQKNKRPPTLTPKKQPKQHKRDIQHLDNLSPLPAPPNKKNEHLTLNPKAKPPNPNNIKPEQHKPTPTKR